MKNLFLFAGLFMALLITSCSKDGVNDSDESNSQEVVFQVSNFTTSTSRSAQNLNKAADNEIPECSDVEAAMVKLTILDASDLATEYTLSLVGINNKTETEPLKLDAGNYRITSFVAYAQDGTTAVWAAPMMGSYYQTLWDLKGVNELPFIVAAFDQVNVEVDVLCYEPHDYQNFGFAWFAFSQTKINTICFFGDICTEFYEQWHTLEGSPYVGQTNNRSSFPAIFSVEVYNEAGVLVNDPDLNSNISWQGTGAPLCIEYPNQIGVDETFSFTISVALPDGKKEEIYNGTFEDTAVASTAGEGGFGGKDGVFTFGAGCTNQGNDVNVTLSKYDFQETQVEKIISIHQHDFNSAQSPGTTWGQSFTSPSVSKEIKAIGVPLSYGTYPTSNGSIAYDLYEYDVTTNLMSYLASTEMLPLVNEPMSVRQFTESIILESNKAYVFTVRSNNNGEYLIKGSNDAYKEGTAVLIYNPNADHTQINSASYVVTNSDMLFEIIF